VRAFLVVLGVVLAVVAAMFLFVPDGETLLGPNAPDEPRPAGETTSVRGDADPIEPPASEDAAGIEGTVRDPEGLPVAGARVVAFRREEPGVSAISGEEGRFRCARLPAGTYSLHARKAGVGSGWLPCVEVRDGEVSRAAVVLRHAVTLAGAVVDEAGMPIAGARVTLDATSSVDAMPTGGPAGFFSEYVWEILPETAPCLPSRDLLSAESGADGRFAFSCLLPGRYDLTATAPGRATSRLESVRAPCEEARIVLRRGGAVFGTVVIAGDTPPARVVVRCGDAEVVLDGGGCDRAFRFDGLPLGRHRVTASGLGFSVAGQGFWVVEGEAAGPVRLVLDPGEPVRGRVVSVLTAAPIPGAVVEFLRGAGSFFGWSEVYRRNGRVRADARGEFTATLSRGSWVAVGAAEGYVHGYQGSMGGFLPSGVPFRLGGDTSDVVVPLLPAGTIRGIVLDREGRPFGRGYVLVSVTARPEGWDPERHGQFHINCTANLDETGRFRLEPGPFAAATLAVHLPAGRTGQAVVVSGQDEVVIRLEHSTPRPKPPAVLTGRVVDEAALPVAGARVALADLRTRTDGDGRFRFQGGHGLHGVPTVSALGFVPHLLARVRLEIGANSTLPDAVLRRKGDVIRGRVTGPEGRSLTGARIKAVHPELPTTTAYSGADGRYELLLPDGAEGKGEWAVAATAPGHRRGRKQVPRTGDEKADFVLEPRCSIRGTLEFRGTEPETVRIQGFNLSNSKRPGGRILYDPRTRRFELLDLRPRSHWLAFHAEGHAPHEVRKVVTKAGETTDLGVVVLFPGGTIEGRLLDAGGLPVKGARVRNSIWWWGLNVGTDARGRFRITRVPPGRNSFGVAVDGKTKGFRVEVEDGKVHDVTWQMED